MSLFQPRLLAHEPLLASGDQPRRGWIADRFQALKETEPLREGEGCRTRGEINAEASFQRGVLPTGKEVYQRIGAHWLPVSKHVHDEIPKKLTINLADRRPALAQA